MIHYVSGDIRLTLTRAQAVAHGVAPKDPKARATAPPEQPGAGLRSGGLDRRQPLEGASRSPAPHCDPARHFIPRAKGNTAS